MEETAKKKESRTVLALDFPFHSPENPEKLLAKARNVLEAVHSYVKPEMFWRQFIRMYAP